MTSSIVRARLGGLFCLMVLFCGIPNANAQTLSGTALANALRGGGYVLVMRHASSPAALPDKTSAHPENAKLERQLDDKGRDTARAMGEALKAGRIQVGDILSSPTFRARQTLQNAGLATPKLALELDEGGAPMDTSADGSRSAWLRAKAAERPASGTNTLLVTHAPNLAGAFGRTAPDVAMGETLVFMPNGTAAPAMVARVKIEDWPGLLR